MTQAKHTLLPLGSFDKTAPDAATDFPCTVITSSNGCPLAYVGNHADYKATANQIVTAVNNYERMREALVAVENAVTYDSEELADAGEYALPRDVLIKIKAILAETEEPNA